MISAVAVDAEARRLRLARALHLIDEAISRFPCAEISGLERLRADVAEALRVAEAVHEFAREI